MLTYASTWCLSFASHWHYTVLKMDKATLKFHMTTFVILVFDNFNDYITCAETNIIHAGGIYFVLAAWRAHTEKPSNFALRRNIIIGNSSLTLLELWYTTLSYCLLPQFRSEFFFYPNLLNLFVTGQ